jgi:hypothetical protein
MRRTGPAEGFTASLSEIGHHAHTLTLTPPMQNSYAEKVILGRKNLLHRKAILLRSLRLATS